MKRALVTGSAGFIGSHVARTLEAQGGWHLFHCDLATGMDCRAVFATVDLPFDLVVHCAAVIPDRDARQRQPLVMAENLEMDAAMLRWATRTKQRRVVYFSSCAAYPVTLPHRSFTEADIDQDLVGPPDALYGWGKLTGELLAHAARAEGLDVLVVRPFSGYGTDQSLSYPFPAMIRRAVERQDPFNVWGSGHQVRDFVHVDDVVGAVLALVEAGVPGPVNIGTSRPTSALKLAQLITSAAGYSPAIFPDVTKPEGAPWRVANTARLRQYYEPKVTLEEGIHRALQG